MELFFNELSFKNKELSYDEIATLANMYIPLKGEGFTACRTSYDDYARIINSATQKEIKDLLFSFLRQPYEDTAVNKEEDTYYSHSWIYADSGQECYGLALAAIFESATVSLNREGWDKTPVNIRRDDELLRIHNYYNADSIVLNHDWVESRKDIVLSETKLRPEEKPRHFRHDHGIAELNAFADIILKSKYVVGVINSLEFKPKGNKFIRKIYPDGKIDIGLTWEPAGYGMCIQTTGKDYRTTEAIAKKLKEKYG